MMLQLWIALTGGLAITLSQSASHERTRYACLFGLASQPGFLYSTYITEQWGMFALAVWYTAGWGKGLYTHWLKRGQRWTG